MLNYQFSLKINSKNDLVAALQQLPNTYIIQKQQEEHFSVQVKKPGEKQKAYQLDVVINGAVLLKEGSKGVVLCKTSLAPSSMFRQWLITIIMLSVLLATWKMPNTGLMIARWVGIAIIAGSFLNIWKTLSTEGQQFKKALQKKLAID